MYLNPIPTQHLTSLCVAEPVDISVLVSEGLSIYGMVIILTKILINIYIYHLARRTELGARSGLATAVVTSSAT